MKAQSRPSTGGRKRRHGTKPAKRRTTFRLEFEPLEDRTLPSVSLAGTIFSDWNGNLVQESGEAGLPAIVAYLDLNQNEVLDGASTVVEGDTSINSGGFGLVASAANATLTASGLPQQLTDISVRIQLTNASTSPVIVGLVSPLGASLGGGLDHVLFNGPNLAVVGTGAFDFTLDEQATTRVTLASGPGTYLPDQSFSAPHAHVFDGNPNGTWGLVFFGDDVSGLTLHGWSIEFTGSEPTTTTAANGDFSFSNLATAAYSLAFVVPPGNVATGATTHQVAFTAGQTVSGLDFGVRPSPDLGPLAPAANVAVTADSTVQQMPSIAVDPLNANHLVMAFMDYSLTSTGYAGIGIATSSDGGATWARSSIPIPTDFDQAAGHPVAQFDSDGNLYVAFMAATFKGAKPPLIYVPLGAERAKGMQANNGIFVARSTDGGSTWSVNAVASQTFTPGGAKVFFDTLPDIAVDAASGALYATWTRFYPAGRFPGSSSATLAGTDIMLAVSTDQGQTWTLRSPGVDSKGVPFTVIKDPIAGNATAAEGGGFSTLSHVTVGPDGVVYVSAFAGGRFAVFHSRDGGNTFVAPHLNSVHGYPFGGATSNSSAASLLAGGFRTMSARQIVADPTRPGVVYVAESIPVLNPARVSIDAGQIHFARSDDYGVTWQHVFSTAGHPSNFDELTGIQRNDFRSAVNDDGDGRFLKFSSDLSGEVTSGQTLPKLTVDADGNILLIWYDTRRDGGGATRGVDVYGAISRDGGKTFSANFRLTDATFDPAKGAFTDASGSATLNAYLGDLLGLSIVDGTAYAAWTGTTATARNQDIFFTKFSIDATGDPVLADDRFEPNDTATTAASLGTISADRTIAGLTIVGGNEDWFSLTAAATGELFVAVYSADAGSLSLELYDATGTTRLDSGAADIIDSAGLVIGKSIAVNGASGQGALARIRGLGLGATGQVGYSLAAHSFTGDLGERVFGTQSNTLAVGATHLYPLIAPLTGSLEVRFTQAATNFRVRALAADGTQLAAAATTLSLRVSAGQLVLLEVTGATAASQDYSLQFTNLDQFQTTQNAALAFPAEGSPSSVAVGDLNNDGKPDIVTSSNQLADVVNVQLGNGDGSFQASRSYAVGAGLNAVPAREVQLADLDGDGNLDIAVTNHNSADVSVLLGRGDGTFQPQRRFDAVRLPDSLAVGDFNDDGKQDLAVLERFSGPARLAILLGNGDGTFQPPTHLPIAFNTTAFPVRAADLNADGHDDLVVVGTNAGQFQVLLGNGDGTFTDNGLFAAGEITLDAQIADMNKDGKLDIVTAGANTGSVYFIRGNGDGTFQRPAGAFAAAAQTVGDNLSIVGLALADVASVNPSTGAVTLGTTDNQLDIVAMVRSRSGAGVPQMTVVAGFTSAGNLLMRPPVQLGTTPVAGKIAVGQFNTGDAVADVVMAGATGLQAVFAKKPVIESNATFETARDLGTVVHLVTQPMGIVPGDFSNSYFKLTVPTEASPGAGDQVIDFAAIFDNLEDAGLGMEVLDAQGNVLATGERIRLVAAQGSELYVHIFAESPESAGSYTIVIDVLPQVVEVVGESLLPGVNGQPGGPVTSFVITLQGDRLDAASAENPANYVVRWLGADGQTNTADDRIIPLASATGSKAVTYNPGANVDVSTGRTFLAAVRQTITLLFDEPLPEGLYQIDLSPAIQTASVFAGESDLVGNRAHPIVSRVAGQPGGGVGLASADQIVEGASVAAAVHLPNGWKNADFSGFETGTPFLTQMHNDLGALLDSMLNRLGDDPSITDAITRQILTRMLPGFEELPTTYFIVWADPVSIDLADPGGNRAVFDLQSNSVASSLARTYVEVGGNVQLMVMAAAAGTFTLNVDHVQPTARAGAIILAPGQVQTVALTDAIRGGERAFTFEMPSTTVASPGSPTTTAGLTSTPGLDAASLGLSQVALTLPILVAATETLVVTTLIVAPPSAGGDLAFDVSHLAGLEEIAREVVAAIQAALSVSDGLLFTGDLFVSAFSAAVAPLRVVGLSEALLPLPAADALEQAVDAVFRAGSAVADRVGAWLRGRMAGAGPAPAAVAPAGAAPAPAEGRDEEEAALRELLQVVPADAHDRLDGMVASAVFASGAFFGTLASGQGRDRRRPLSLAGEDR